MWACHRNSRACIDWRGEWQLPPLNGISTSPVLVEDRAIRAANGYDAEPGLWCENVPDSSALVPPRPTKEKAAVAVALVRQTFETLPFADTKMITDVAQSASSRQRLGALRTMPVRRSDREPHSVPG
jgi:hypothetical protein